MEAYVYRLGQYADSLEHRLHVERAASDSVELAYRRQIAIQTELLQMKTRRHELLKSELKTARKQRWIYAVSALAIGVVIGVLAGR